MVNYIQSGGGYFYKKYQNGKSIRISQKNFLQKGGLLVQESMNDFENLLEKNKKNMCIYENKNKRNKIISNNYINNLIDDNDVFYSKEGETITAFILYNKTPETNYEKTFYSNNFSSFEKKSKKFTVIFIEILCSNINFKGAGTALFNEFLRRNYNENTLIFLKPATESLINYYRTKLIYKPVSFSKDYGYLFFTPNKDLIYYLDFEKNNISENFNSSLKIH